ncbi:MAG: beta-propeller domain-containing protein [Myxococcota bacterium]
MRHAASLLLLLALAGCASTASDGSLAAAAPADESITNVQEEGVDEGGIVKAAGDYLIVLRRGRLFTVELGDESMTPVCMVDAFAPGSRLGTWYDEMLVDGDQVVVVGYSYRVGATELGMFELSSDGCIAHRDTYFLRSNDYYSTRNYASRLVDGELIFYMPHVFWSGYNPERLRRDDTPAFRAHDEDWHLIVERSDIRQTSDLGRTPTLHTVVRCDLRAADMGCRAHGIVGGFARSFYVSPNAVYVWTHADAYVQTGSRARGELYRLPLDDRPPSGVQVWGAPTDQFSFKENAEGDLHVLVRSEGLGDWMGAPEHSAGDVALVTIPSELWPASGVRAADWSLYSALPRPGGPTEYRPMQNRFVGNHVLYGVGATWWTTREDDAALYVYDLSGERAVDVLDLPHDVGRIEAMGEHAVIVGAAENDLYFSSLRLGAEPEVVDQIVEEGASQGELRSHGFFYKARSANEGTLALPIRSAGAGYRHLYHGSASIAFVDSSNLALTRLGYLDSTDDAEDDRCLVSCVDWYGNARPIFYRGRTFALLGYELVEGALLSEGIEEVGRIHLMGDQNDDQKVQLDAAYTKALDDNPGYDPNGYADYGCSASGRSSSPIALLALLAWVARRRR